MRNAAAMLYCLNPTCQAPNSETDPFCQKCGAFLPRRYLWALGDAGHAPGDLIGDRYLCQQPRVFLDTKPGLLSSTYQELPERFLPYLRLVSDPLHVPQVYDWLPASLVGNDLVLLDHVPLYRTSTGLQPLDIQSLEGAEPPIALLPSVATSWGQASALRQLNWLWQIASLWEPLSRENAESSLLDAENLRVDGTLVRLLELSLKPRRELSDLGAFWSQGIAAARPEIAGFLTQLCQGLTRGEIYNAELLLGYLDEALAQTSAARHLTIATLSDRGSTRQRNEDACYPKSGSPTLAVSLASPASGPSGPASSPTQTALTLVCDGIGGHQGGDVASQLAISSLERQVKALDLEQLDPVSLSVALEKAICAANDEISQQNDSEHRFERQRMGTTVVMALARRHELYVAHVGDSRVYLLTQRGCHQLTLDDDVASREVRLGYSLYRQALQQPSSGSLVQALGMSASAALYPTVQRLLPDEDCIILLCSDGLSDNERVEEAWETEVLPLLEQSGPIELAALAQRLVALGNQRNGYDNVTVSLIHYQVAASQPVPTLSELPLVTASRPAAPAIETQPTALVSPADSKAAVQAIGIRPSSTRHTPSPSRSLLPWIGLGVLLCGLAGLGAALWPAWQNGPADPFSGPTPTVASSPARPAAASSAALLAVGSFIQIQPLPDPTASKLSLLSSAVPAGPAPGLAPSSAPSSAPSPPPSAGPVEPVGVIAAGSVLQVLTQQSSSQQESWIKLRVCSLPPNSPSASLPVLPPVLPPGELPPAPPAPLAPMLQSGQTGWIREAEIAPQAVAVEPPNQPQACL